MARDVARNGIFWHSLLCRRRITNDKMAQCREKFGAFCFGIARCWSSAFRLLRPRDMLKHELQRDAVAKQETLARNLARNLVALACPCGKKTTTHGLFRPANTCRSEER